MELFIVLYLRCVFYFYFLFSRAQRERSVQVCIRWMVWACWSEGQVWTQLGSWDFRDCFHFGILFLCERARALFIKVKSESTELWNCSRTTVAIYILAVPHRTVSEGIQAHDSISRWTFAVIWKLKMESQNVPASVHRYWEIIKCNN